jgi:uncharacterized repeat protein (TIGR01451 family)
VAALASDINARIPQQLLVEISDGSATYIPGGTSTYAIRVRNGGSVDAFPILIENELPPGATLAGAVTCMATGTAACGSIDADARGNVVRILGARIAAGSGDVVTYAVPVRFVPTLAVDVLVNTVSASVAGVNAIASDANARGAPVDALAIPVDSAWLRAVLALALGILAARRLRGRRAR